MKAIKSLLVALGLSLSALAAQAAVIYSFGGTVDPGSSQAGEAFSGSLSFAAAPANPDDFVELTDFEGRLACRDQARILVGLAPGRREIASSRLDAAGFEDVVPPRRVLHLLRHARLIDRFHRFGVLR